MPVEQQRPHPGAKRRSRRHVLGRRRAIALAAASAASAIKLDPGHMRADRRDVDVFVAAPALLPGARDVGRAVWTGCGEALDRLVRGIAQPAADTGPRRPRLARLRLALSRTTSRFLVLRRRRVAVLRGLLRPRQQRLELRHPHQQAFNKCRLLGQQRVLLPLAQAVSKWRSHSYVESDSHRSRTRKMPKNPNPVSSYSIRTLLQKFTVSTTIYGCLCTLTVARMTVDYKEAAAEVHDTIGATPKKSKRVLLKTLLNLFGHKNRKEHSLSDIERTLVAAGVTVMPSLNEVGRKGWVTLSVTDPMIPVGDFSPKSADAVAKGGCPDPSADPWFSALATQVFNSEREVEIRFVLPLLERLGFSEDDRADGFPVVQVVGVKKSKTQADFVLFNGRNRTKDSALLVVEAKSIGKNLEDHISQARSYAMFLGAPYFLVTNGDEIRAFLYRSPIESDVEVFKAKRQDLTKTFRTLYNVISREAIVEYKHRKSAAGG